MVLIFGGFLTVLLIVGGALSLSYNKSLAIDILSAGAVAMVVTALWYVFDPHNRIYAKAIEADSVTMDGLSSEFVAALGQGSPRVGNSHFAVPAGGMELQTAKYFRS